MKPCPAEHPRLPRGVAWLALGDVALLDVPQLEPVILSRSLSPRELEARLAALEAAVREGAAVVGGFISRGEAEAARRLARLPGLRLVRVLPFPLACYRPGPGAERRIREGRTLILSAFAEGDGRLTRSACVQVNRWVLALCREPCGAPRVPRSVSEALPEPIHEPCPAVSADDDPGAIFL